MISKKLIILFLALPVIINTNIDAITDATTKLNQAIMNDSAEEVRQAVKDGANVNVGKDGKPPILWAVLLQKSKSVQALLACGANTNVTCAGNTLVQHAMKLYDLKTAKLLIKAGANFLGNVDQSRTVFDIAMISGDIELLQALVDHGWDIHNNTTGYVGGCSLNARLTNVWHAARGELVSFFIKNGANPNQIVYDNGYIGGASWTPLLFAVEHGDTIAIELLLAAGADINLAANPWRTTIQRNTTPLSYSIMIGRSYVTELLLKHGATLYPCFCRSGVGLNTNQFRGIICIIHAFIK